jgi:putative phosphoesterase
MRVGLISDIHANLPALEAVLESMPDDLDGLVCAGDIVGYSAWPTACVDRIRETCDVVVQGNHDRDVRNPDSYVQNEMAHTGLQYAKSQLSTEQLSWLSELPASTHAFDDRIYVVHGHPENVDRYVSKGMFTAVATYMSEATQILALGHTHKQAAVNMAKFSRHGWVVNPGSVGQPRDGNPTAAYAIVDLEIPAVELHRAEYPIAEVKRAHDDVGLPLKSAKRLEKGE